jgi:hypothetical protein
MEWQFILAIALIVPVLLFVPAIVWVAVASGLAKVMAVSIRRRARALLRMPVRAG